jgi:hypothetical protein
LSNLRYEVCSKDRRRYTRGRHFDFCATMSWWKYRSLRSLFPLSAQQTKKTIKHFINYTRLINLISLDREEGLFSLSFH